MSQIKILVTIEGIEGATLHSVGKSKIPFVITKADIHWQNHKKEYTREDKDKIVRKGVRRITNFEAVSCSKSIKLTKEAYDYMTSKESPEWYFKKDWGRLSSTQRLELHLKRLCEHNGGKSFSYSILEN